MSEAARAKLEEDLEGLLHISELSDHKIESPEEVVRPGMKIEVRVIRVDIAERKIGLSFVHADFEENANVPKAPAPEASGDGDGGDSGGVEIVSVDTSVPEAPAEEAPKTDEPSEG